jgi:hypothetical protein
MVGGGITGQGAEYSGRGGQPRPFFCRKDKGRDLPRPFYNPQVFFLTIIIRVEKTLDTSQLES